MTEILQYIPGTSLLHRLHPVTKLIAVLVIVSLCVFSPNLVFLLLLLVAIFFVAAACRLHHEFIRQLPFLGLLIIILVIITVCTVTSGPVIGHLIPEAVPVIGGAFPITTGGLMLGLLLSFRFIVMILTFQLFIFSTKPSELVSGLLIFRMPVDYVLMFLITIRFIPSLQMEGRRIHEAQLSRGYNPGTGIKGKIKSLKPILIPLVANSLAKTQVIGLTLDMRGYRTKNRLLVHKEPYTRYDLVAACCLALVIIGFVYQFLMM